MGSKKPEGCPVRVWYQNSNAIYQGDELSVQLIYICQRQESLYGFWLCQFVRKNLLKIYEFLLIKNHRHPTDCWCALKPKKAFLAIRITSGPYSLVYFAKRYYCKMCGEFSHKGRTS